MEFGLVGPSYTARSTAVADEECINLYVETSGGQGGSKSLLYTPGLDVFATFPTSPTRGSIYAANRLFVVSGDGLYELTASRVRTLRANVANDGNAVSIASNGFQLLIVSAGRAYCFTIATLALLDVTAQLAAIPDQVQYSDSYFVVKFRNSNEFQISNFLDGTNWPGIQVNAPSVFPENVVSIMVNHRELWVFGARHAQPYQDTGSTEVFDVIPGAFIETGSAATLAPCLLDNSIFWISEDERGARMAWRSNGYTPSRISTYAVEVDLASYPTLAGMTTYAYQDGGHLFWVLYIPGSQWSWVFDVGESLWHKRVSTLNGVSCAHLGWNHAYAFGLHLVGDWNSGTLYSMSQNVFTDNGTPIRRLRRSPTLENEMQYIRHSELVLDFDMGNISTVAPTDKPTLAESLYGPLPGTAAANTDTGGASWSNVTRVLSSNVGYADAALNVVVQSLDSKTSSGSSTGGGVAWTNPGNIDSPVSFATVSLSAGGDHINAVYTGTVSNSCNPSNQFPPSTSTVLTGLPSTVATDATIYAVVKGSVVASSTGGSPSGGGTLSLYSSIDNGSTWVLQGSYRATFPSVTVGFTVSGLANLNTVQLKLVAACSCSPTGFATVSLTVTEWYAILPSSGQPTSQTLVAAISGLVLPTGKTIKGFGLAFNADYTGAAPTFQVALNVGSTVSSFTLTTTPATYPAGGSASLWGFDAWDATTLANLTAKFSASSTGTTTVSINQLVATVYFTDTDILSDAIDITAFNFAIPATATPAGIIPVVLAYADSSGAQLNAQLLKAGAPVGAVETLPLSTEPSLLTFGGLTELFLTTWQDVDLNDAGFGLRITANTTTAQSIPVHVGFSTLQLYCPDTLWEQTYIGPDPGLVDGNGNPRPPQIMVRWSDDRGKSWSNEHIVDCGNLGEYTKRARLSRLGRSRYRVYEISMSDAVPWVIRSGYLKAAL